MVQHDLFGFSFHRITGAVSWTGEMAVINPHHLGVGRFLPVVMTVTLYTLPMMEALSLQVLTTIAVTMWRNSLRINTKK
jgi:hypothetical protein